jgi:hypothetical protein
MHRLLSSVAVLVACVGLVSCAGGGRYTVAVSPAKVQPDGLTVTMDGTRLAYDADAKLTAARGVLFVRSATRAAALQLAAVQHVIRTKNGVPEDVEVRTLPVEERFFAKPARTQQTCLITPQRRGLHPKDACDPLPPDADLFEKMEYATGPGEIIPGLAHGGGANCPDFFQVGTLWRIVNFDITTGDGDPNGTCISLTSGGGGSFGPTLGGYATDYRYDSVNWVVALDFRLPGDKTTTRSYLMKYRGPGILIDGAIGTFGLGQTSATIDYYLGTTGSGLFSTMQVDMYQGPLVIVGSYLGYARGTNPRFASVW